MVFSRLRNDIRAVMERDPAVKSVFEVLLCYPGLHALIMHRIAHGFYRRRWFVVARFISHLSRFLTGIEIHPGAKIGEGLFIDHGSGVVIGETAEIGDNVTIYQGVTLGTGRRKERGIHHRQQRGGQRGRQGTILYRRGQFQDWSGFGGFEEVPPDSTVVGVPGKVVARNGRKVAPREDYEIDLRHDLLPDPVAEMIRCMQRKIDRLEKRVRQMEEDTSIAETVCREGKLKCGEDCLFVLQKES